MEELIDTVTDISLHYAAVATFGMLFNNSTRITEEHAWLDQSYSLVETFPRRLHHSYGFRVGPSLVADVIGLIKVTMEATMIYSDVDIDDVAVNKDALIGNTMTDGFVDRGAAGFWKPAIVKRRWI